VKYWALFNGAAEPIFVLDGDGVIQEANAAAEALLGRTTTGLKGSSSAEVLGEQSAEVLREALSSPKVRAELRFSSPDGSDVWLEPLCTAVQGPAGESLAQVLLKDVTERRGLEHYAREITRAQEAERQRIAQELHDVSVQSAIMICRRLDAAANAVEEGIPEDINRSLAEARQTAETMADELRRFSRDLRPLILDDLGLVPALKRLLLELRERCDIDVRLNTTGSVRRLDSSVELAMFRIGQEALRNIELHAKASYASAGIEFGEAIVVLTITDNGSGFEVPRLPILVGAGRLGLLGMQERAQLVGGVCEIHSIPGRGTTVVATVPSGGPSQTHAPTP
jgi:PAS domain S-box-containing protein